MHKKKERKKSQDFRVICVKSKSSLKLWISSQSQVESFISVSQVSLKSTEFECVTVIGCHCYKKSVCEMSSLRDIPQSLVSGIISKWKWQTRSGRPCKVTERGHWVLRHTLCKSHQRSADSVTAEFQTTMGINISAKTVCWELHGMGNYGQAAAHQPNTTKHNTMYQMEYVKPTDCSAAETSSVTWRIILLYLAIWWTRVGLVNSRRTLSAWLHRAKCKVWWRRDVESQGTGNWVRSVLALGPTFHQKLVSSV